MGARHDGRDHARKVVCKKDRAGAQNPARRVGRLGCACFSRVLKIVKARAEASRYEPDQTAMKSIGMPATFSVGLEAWLGIGSGPVRGGIGAKSGRASPLTRSLTLTG